jgi:diguanylate cyclase (GGDEF)-like protein/PAS domain S-box-containing protein
MTQTRLANKIFWMAVGALLVIFTAQYLIVEKFWLVLLDDLHWTLANACAALLAWLGFRESSGAARTARRWFFIGLSAYAMGQLLWDIQVFIGWNPFPAPSDIFYLMLGPCCLFGLVAAIRIQLPKNNQQITILDTALLSIAILSLVLTIYLPKKVDNDLLTFVVMTAYPVVLLTAACFGILVVLHLRPRPAWAWIFFQMGLGLQGLIWMWWNVQALTNTTVDGSFLNQLFSVASLILGVAAMRWSIVPSDNLRYEKWCEGLLRMLPLLAVVIAALASVLVLSFGNVSFVHQQAVLFATLAVIALAALRQSLMLGERDRLLQAEKAVAESHKLLQLVIDTAPLRVFWKDCDLRYLGGNAAFARDAGVPSASELIGKDDYQLVWKEQAEQFRAENQQLINSDTPALARDKQLVIANGKVIWVRASTIPLHNNKNEVIGILGIYDDITERKRIEEGQRIAAVTFDTQEAIMITDPDANILRVNQAFQDITGYDTVEVIGCNPRIFQSGRHDAAFYQALWSGLLKTGKWSGEIWDKRKDGSIYPKMMTITAVRDDNQRITNYVAVFRDISQHKKSEQEIHQLAFYDALTLLPNRRLLLDRLQQSLAVSMRNGRYGSLLFLDMDHFKTINDTRGHAMGDLLLIEVARRLLSCVREGDSVARLGGDEFVVLLENLSSKAEEASSQTKWVAEKIRLELDQPYILKDYECLSTVSIGISLFNGHAENAEDLLMHADVAMYQAKTAGRNAIRFFDPHMQASLESRAALEADLRHALEKQQFSLYYQIQVDSARQVLGAEVLLRWNHPERGLVSPMQFIPLAEETGLIVPIGLWVLQTACAQLKEWQRDALTRGLTLAVNVSAKQFRQTDFVAQVQRILLTSGVQPSHLKLELTETTVLENVEDTIGKMNEIKSFGVGFSMDDFGTGYSSLQYLKRLPLNQIKIDQSFVRDIATDPNDAAIVRTIIVMSEALGLNVIAEGVETEAQFKFLDGCGCHAFQGYLFGKPLPLQEIAHLLESTSTVASRVE